MKRTLSLIAILALLIPLNGQRKTFFTVEAGPHWSMIKVDDPGNYFKPANVNSTIMGFTIEQEVIENISVATGLYYQPYKTGINMIDSRKVQCRLNSHDALMIPVRVQYRVQPTEYPVSFTPRVGYMYSLNSLSADPFANASVLSEPDGTAFSYNLDKSQDEPGSHLLEMGMGIGLRISGLWQASVNISYLTGVLNTPVTSSTLVYTDQQGNTYTADYNTKGNGLYTSLSFHLPVSNIWQNRDYRIRSRIENSTYTGKEVERKGQFYAGGEVGALWRLFQTTNPAIGARPMEGRGLFRYANLHTGIYAGYMLTQELGVDLGVNYQRSNTFYALMYDHEVDFVDKTGAPLYLEVPLRIRYFYDVYKEKIFAVVYGGASLLTHFSSGSYSSPGGDFSYTSPASQSEASGTVSSTSERPSRIRPLVRLGAGVEYMLPIKFPMFVTGYINYMQGFISTEQIRITTSVPETPGVTVLIYRGSGWSFDVGVKIPFSTDDRQNCVRLTKRKKEKS